MNKLDLTYQERCECAFLAKVMVQVKSEFLANNSVVNMLYSFAIGKNEVATDVNKLNSLALNDLEIAQRRSNDRLAMYCAKATLYGARVVKHIAEHGTIDNTEDNQYLIDSVIDYLVFCGMSRKQAQNTLSDLMEDAVVWVDKFDKWSKK